MSPIEAVILMTFEIEFDAVTRADKYFAHCVDVCVNVADVAPEMAVHATGTVDKPDATAAVHEYH